MDKKDGDKGIVKLFNFRPVFFAAVFLCLGIIFCFLYRFHGVSACWLLCLIPLAGTPFLFCRTRERAWKTAWAIVFCGVFFFLGFFGFFLQANAYFDREEYLGKNYITGYVVEKRVYDGQTGIVLDGLRIGEEEVPGKLVAYLPSSFDEEITLTDELFLRGNVREIAVDKDNFTLMAKQFGDHVRFRVWAEDATVTGRRFDLFLFLRMRAENAIDRGMDETPAAVTKAVLFGNTDGIDEDLYESIRRGGIAHIFAVSGLHVGALFAFCLLLVEKTSMCALPKIGKFAFLSLLLFGYAGICGFSASVLRATVICLVSYASILLGIRTDFLESLGLALILVLLSTPSALFEVGCQLSFAACFGIAFFSKPIGQVFDELKKLYRKLFPRPLTRAEKEAIKNDDTLPPSLGERVYRAVSSFFAASFGAQIFTAPILLSAFGYVSGWGLLLNCLFIPLMSVAFSALLIFVVIASFMPLEFAFVLLYIPNAVWSLVLLTFQVFDFSSFAISGLKLSAGSFICYYLGCTFLTDKWNLKKSFSRALALVCFLAFAVTMIALNV